MSDYSHIKQDLIAFYLCRVLLFRKTKHQQNRKTTSVTCRWDISVCIWSPQPLWHPVLETWSSGGCQKKQGYKRWSPNRAYHCAALRRDRETPASLWLPLGSVTSSPDRAYTIKWPHLSWSNASTMPFNFQKCESSKLLFFIALACFGYFITREKRKPINHIP